MSHRSPHDPEEGALYLRAVAGMHNGSRLLLAAVAASPTGFVVLLDLDSMGMVNRKFGTRVGDRLIAGVESALHEAAAGRGGIAHLGGDQFLAVLPGTEEPDSVVCDLLAAVRRTRVGSARVTASAGRSQWSQDRARPHELLTAAARALEQAKLVTHAQ